MIRQVGILFERVAPAGALAINKQLVVGQPAPNLQLQTISNELITIGGTHPNLKAQLIFFLSPDCPICKTLLPVLRSTAKAELDWLQIIIASDGKEQDHKSFVSTYGLETFPYVISELLGKTYGVAKLPYGVLIDKSGIIKSLGIVNSREHLESLFEANELGFSSIQEFLKSKQR
ncbi:MAG: redoxin domain-containing protein [Methylacidiphilales bacterium]|nr:redoxin domain-containing protein [Candidatus Methylacidiphilales bacterium]